jgi:hypothetical protein
MIILGLVLLVLGLLLGINALWIIGLVLLAVGLIVNLVPLGGRHYRVW